MKKYQVLYVDPGTNAAGWCGTNSGVFVSCGLLRPKRQDIYADIPGAEKAIHVEIPVIYPRGRQKARPADVIKLAAAAGELATIAKIRGGGKAEISKHEPRSWKGQLPKAIVCERVLEALTPKELRIYRDCMLLAPDGLHHNVLEAIGLWLSLEDRI